MQKSLSSCCPGFQDCLTGCSDKWYLFTVQVASTLEKMLAAPALLVPFGQASDNCHLANERLQRINLVKGKNVIKHLLNEVGTV